MKKNLLFASIFCLTAYNIFSQALPNVNPISGPATVCSSPSNPQTYGTSASGNVLGYSWTVTPSNGVIIGNQNASVTTISFPANSPAYVVSCSAFNSLGSGPAKSLVVYCNETPKVTFSGASIFCQGSPTYIQASATTIGASSTISYTWNPTSGLSSPYIANPVAYPSSSTNYTITYAMGNCTNTAQLFAYVAICNSIKENKASEYGNLLVYPNPSNGEFYIRTDTELEAVLYDNQGKQVRKFKVNPSEEKTISGLAPGIYYIVADNRRRKIIITQ
jgi:hypothetical protein